MPSLETILAILAALVGWPALVALVIDILKYVGVVDDGTAGKWNLGFNLLGFILVGVTVGFFPNIDIGGIDKNLLAWVQVAAYIFTLIVQILGTRAFHALYIKTEFGRKYFTYDSSTSKLLGYPF